MAGGATTECPLCRQPFGSSLFKSERRKKQCNKCSRTVCAKCCQQRFLLPQVDATQTKRVCDQCARGGETATLDPLTLRLMTGVAKVDTGRRTSASGAAEGDKPQVYSPGKISPSSAAAPKPALDKPAVPNLDPTPLESWRLAHAPRTMSRLQTGEATEKDIVDVCAPVPGAAAPAVEASPLKSTEEPTPPSRDSKGPSIPAFLADIQRQPKKAEEQPKKAEEAVAEPRPAERPKSPFGAALLADINKGKPLKPAEEDPVDASVAAGGFKRRPSGGMGMGLTRQQSRGLGALKSAVKSESSKNLGKALEQQEAAPANPPAREEPKKPAVQPPAAPSADAEPPRRPAMNLMADIQKGKELKKTPRAEEETSAAPSASAEPPKRPAMNLMADIQKGKTLKKTPRAGTEGQAGEVVSTKDARKDARPKAPMSAPPTSLKAALEAKMRAKSRTLTRDVVSARVADPPSESGPAPAPAPAPEAPKKIPKIVTSPAPPELGEDGRPPKSPFLADIARRRSEVES